MGAGDLPDRQVLHSILPKYRVRTHARTYDAPSQRFALSAGR